MAQERGSFGIVGKAWETAKIYNGSNTISRYDGVVESNSLQTLADYVRSHGIETIGMDMDSKADDRLARYNVVKFTPTRKLGEFENALEVYLITDEKGHDIGTYEITEKGPKFKLSEKIESHNKEIMSKFQGEGREILESHYDVNTLETLVEKLAKGEDVALASEEQAKDDITEEYESRGFSTGAEQAEPDEEQEALEGVPQDMRAEAIEFARERGLKVKEILIVDNPKELAGSIDNRENQISENGGPIILIRTKTGRALDLDDDVYALQDGNAVQNEANDKILGSYMKSHEDEGHVTGLEPIDNNSLVLEAEKIYEEAQMAIEAEQEAIEQIEYNMENIEIDQDSDQDAIMEQMREEISTHEANIENIIEKRDLDLKTLLSRAPREKVVEENVQEVSEEELDDEAIKDRWSQADPNKPKN